MWRSLSDSPLDKSRRLSQQTEIHGHGENKSLGLSVQQKWCVLPLAHGVDRRACEKLDRAKYGDLFDPSVASDRCLQNHETFDSRAGGKRRIDWRDSLHQRPCLNLTASAGRHVRHRR